MAKTITLSNYMKANNYTILTISFESDQDLSGNQNIMTEEHLKFRLSLRSVHGI